MEHYVLKTKETPQVIRTAFIHNQLGAADRVTASALTPDGRLPEGKSAPGGEPRTVIRLENDSLTREIAFYPYDALHSAMAVDGVCRFYVSNDALDALSAAP